MSAAINMPSLYFSATTDVPVTYGNLHKFHKFKKKKKRVGYSIFFKNINKCTPNQLQKLLRKP